MTVNTTKIVSGPYAGNDIADTFSYTFRVVDKDQLAVYETDDNGVETLLTVDTDYTVNSVGDDNGGTITRIAGALPTGYTWYIRSDYDYTQLTAFQSQGAFFPDLHEDAMDKLTFLLQQLLDRQDRAPRLSDSYTGDLPILLENPIAGFALRWNGDADGLENYDPSTVSNEEIANDKVVINYNSITTAINDSSLKLNQTCIIGEATPVSNGTDTWDVVSSIGVTPGDDAVVSVAVPSLALIRRYQSEGFDSLDSLVQSSYKETVAVVSYFDSNNKAGSGGRWVRDGTTGTPSTTDYANGKIYNRLGLGYVLSPENGKIAPVQLGAVGDNITDDTTSLNNFFAFTNLSGYDVDGLNHVHYTQAVSGSYNGIINRLKLRAASVQEFLLRLDVSTSLKVYDSDFDCDGVAAKGLYARNQSAITTPVFASVNTKSRNFAQSGTTGQAAGIQVEGRFRKAVSIECDISDGSSSDPTPVVRGITFEPNGTTGQSPQLAVVEGGSVSNIQATNDADGVNYTLPSAGDQERYRLKVTDVDFVNCSKRSVKSQIRNAIVSNNIFTFSGTPVGSRFAEIEFQRGGGVCVGNKFFTDTDQTTGFRYVQTSDDDNLIANNATVIANNEITSRQGDEFVFGVVTDDTSQPARSLKGIKINDNIYNGTCQYFLQLNPVAHGAGATTTIIDNLEVASNEMSLVTAALIWHGRRSGPSTSSRVRLSVHDNMHGDAATASVPLIFQNTSNLSRVYIKDADNTNFDAGI